ncbi:MAG: glycoside hydrolase family 88 protein [Oscillospiraceae bacterium]|nr:glycoside hydrolase family 88 protein [Oscillospiraceae bacterium]
MLKIDVALIEKVNNRMLHLSNTGIQETCPIGIIDFDKWEWPQGVGLYGIWKYYETNGNPVYLQYLNDWFNNRIFEGLPAKNVNTMAPMLTLACMAEKSGNKEHLALCSEWAEWIMEEMPRTEEGGLQHIVSGETNEQQLWDDTLFMTVLFLGKMGKILKKSKYIEESYYQFLLHAKYLCDRKTGLWFHGWNFIDRSNFAQALWARGNCWITAGIPDYLEIMNFTGVKKRYLVGLLETQVKALAKLQCESGMWNTLLDDPNSYEEASATAGFTYGILKGVHMGILPKKYKKIADKGVKGVVACIDGDGTVQQVSYGTGMSYTLQHYREIPLCPMAYGQSLTVLMLGEVLR